MSDFQGQDADGTISEGDSNGISRRQAMMAGMAGLGLAAASGLAGSRGAAAQTPEAAAGEGLTIDVVLAGLGGAVAKATELGVPMGVAIFNQGGTLLGFVRMPGTPETSAILSQQKGYTAASFGAPTADFVSAVSGDPALMASLLKIENVTLVGGGLPIISGEAPIGGVGCSGGPVEMDIACATAALTAMGFA